jgi:hypothetical protein
MGSKTDAMLAVEVGAVRNIYELLDKIEHPSVIFSSDQMQMAIDAVEFCQLAAKKIRTLLPAIDESLFNP